MHTPKPWYKSVVVWINFLSAVALALGETLDIIKAVVSPEIYAVIAIIVAFLNIYLRLHVRRPLDYNPKAPKTDVSAGNARDPP